MSAVETADPQAGAAMRFGHRDPEPAGVGKRLVEVQRKPAFTVLAQPVIGVEGRADALDGVADLFLLGRQ